MIVKSSSLKVPVTCYLWLHIELAVNVTSPNNAHYQLLGKPQTRHVCICFEHQDRGENLSFLGVIGCVEKFPLVDLQLYFLIYKPEFTWNYDGI